MSYSDYLAGVRDGISIGFSAGVRAGYERGVSTGYIAGYNSGYRDSSAGLRPRASESLSFFKQAECQAESFRKLLAGLQSRNYKLPSLYIKPTFLEECTPKLP